jgi:hypothetical protein
MRFRGGHVVLLSLSVSSVFLLLLSPAEANDRGRTVGGVNIDGAAVYAGTFDPSNILIHVTQNFVQCQYNLKS